MTALRKITALLLLAGLLAGLGGQALAAEAEGQTALDVMRQINTALPVDPQDNYRTYYEVFVYSFYDSDGDGVGDLPGLLEKLDCINDGDPATDADLGCTGLWLLPVCPSPTYHKYDVTDYCAIDPAYGTLDDFRALADACHARGMYLLVDLVMNHTSSSHPWFTQAAEYLRSLEPGAEPDPEACPYVDYYNFSRDSGSGRYALEGTDWYYEAPFWSEMPDLDLNCQAVRAEFDAIVDFWLAQGADGFRLDGAKEYFSGDPDANVQTLSWFNDMVKSKRPDAYIVAEVWTALSSYAPYYASGIDSCFNFAFADSQGTIANSIKRLQNANASTYGRAIVNFQQTVADYADSYIDAPFYTNHDMGRSAGYYPGQLCENQVKMAQAMNLLMSGSAFLYYGEELGMKGAGKDENKRAPMFWSEDPGQAGMCAGPPDMEDVAMRFAGFDGQDADGNSILNFVRQAIRLRGAWPALSHGQAVFHEQLSSQDVCVLEKRYESQQALLVFNISPESQTVDLSPLDMAPVLSGCLVSTPEAPALEGEQLTLPMYSVALLTPAGA